MDTWYFRTEDQEHGPIAQDTLLLWIMDGKIPPETLIRSEETNEWRAAGAVFPGFFADQEKREVLPWKAGGKSLVPAPSPGGNAGRTPIWKLYSTAWHVLAGKWPWALLAVLLSSAVGRALGEIPKVGWVFALLLWGPITLGMTTYFLTLVRGARPRVHLLLVGFPHFVRSCTTYLSQTLLIVLWSLLLIVPGIIAMLNYSQTFYLLADNSALSPTAALKTSKRIMQGRRWKLCLYTLPFTIVFLASVILTFMAYRAGQTWVGRTINELAVLLVGTVAWVFAGVFYDDLHPAPQAVTSTPEGPACGDVSPPATQ